MFSEKIKIIYILLTIFLFLSRYSHGSIPNEDCLGCHEKLNKYNHKNVNCTQCHSNILSLPHDEQLKKPLCITCHKNTVEIYKKSVHNTKKLYCKDCHDAHFINKEKKNCIQCHPDVSHKRLPAKEKHLKTMDCLACHSKATAGHIEVHIDTEKRDIIKLDEIDRDRNKFLDYIEWDNLQNILKKEFKERAEIKKFYVIKAGDVHDIPKKSVSCNSCHAERGIFGYARIIIKGKKLYEIKGDPKIFIHELPPIEDYKKTIHGKKGVGCSHCHISDKPVSDKVCLSCHENIYSVYKDTGHAKEGATKCIDCHNPHKIRSYKELSTSERVMVCARCHKDYIETHKWLPHTVLHFRYLECSSCHSPESKKGMLFNFAVKEKAGVAVLTYNDFEKIFGHDVSVSTLIDANKDNIISLDELISFVNNLRKKLAKEIVINSSIAITEVYHNYSEKNLKSRVCTECHLLDAPFYKSMMVSIPEKDRMAFMPVKGTILSAFPTSIFIDLCILGETKIKHDDIKAFLMANIKEKPAILKELGFKLIDFIGITVILLIIVGIFVHTMLRILVKK